MSNRIKTTKIAIPSKPRLLSVFSSLSQADLGAGSGAGSRFDRVSTQSNSGRALRSVQHSLLSLPGYSSIGLSLVDLIGFLLN
jgi:hypothetical protein